MTSISVKDGRPVTTAPRANRPGRPSGEAPALAVLAWFAALFGAGLLGWVLLACTVWAVWLARVYVATASAVLLAAFVVTGCATLFVKGNGKAKALASGVFAGVVWFVYWVVTR